MQEEGFRSQQESQIHKHQERNEESHRRGQQGSQAIQVCEEIKFDISLL